MAKGLFTQGMCVLLRRPMELDDIRNRLKSFELVAHQETMDDDDSPQTLIYNFRPDSGGNLLVTPSRIAWPDDMGDPDESPERFVAWSLGQFGPLAFPGCLERAKAQSWAWSEATERVAEHTAHVRLLISYVLGCDDEDENAGDADEEELPMVPDDYDSIEELQFLTKAVTTLLEAPEAICYFNPGGEMLRDESALRQGLNYAWNHDLPPLEMWTNVRFFGAEEDWAVLDTVGNGQFDLPDMEAVYRQGAYEPSEVEQFIRSATLYLLSSEDEVGTGDTADGPGKVSWRALECADALSDPPRPTIRWFPEDGHTPPDKLLDPGQSEDDEDEDDLDLSGDEDISYFDPQEGLTDVDDDWDDSGDSSERHPL